ncbi:hypothetical protein [Siccirubricoccus phaeus]|uniref:hypothetical protein n=1 Tax=Siccirubricoccus phaeus TaxID=2595053 RepID=UPI0011F1DA8D|nr:hypothetical protein [Siccirubricoccus phaeus]
MNKRTEAWRNEFPSIIPWALAGSTPNSLVAVSYEIDVHEPLITLKAHFGTNPTEDDLDTLATAEAEILAAMPDEVRTNLTHAVVPPDAEPAPLAGGFAWRRGDPEWRMPTKPG